MKRLLWLLFCSSFFASAQTGGKFGIEATVGAGSVVPHKENVGYLDRSFYPTFELAFSFNPDSAKPWVKRHGRPQLGISYHHSYYTDKLLGTAHAIYPWYRNRLYNLKGNHNLYYRIGFGLGYLTQTFQNNPENTVISSSFNVAFDGRLEYAYRFAQNQEVGLVYGLYHFSNAATRKPNYGLNHQVIYFRYALGLLPDFKKRYKQPVTGKKFEVLFLPNFALRQNRPNDPMDLIGNFNIEFNWRANGSFRYGAGVSVFYQAFEKQYDRFIDEFAEGEHPQYAWNDLLTYGAYLNSEWVFNKFSAVFQFGAYLNRTYETLEGYIDYGLGKGLHTHYMYMNRSYAFHRIGFRYRPSDYTVLSLTLKTYFAQAVYPEFGVGFRL